MEEKCIELKKLLDEVPVHGYGTVADLDNVYRKARNIILEVAAMEEHKNMRQELGVSSADIDSLISHARKAKTQKEVKQFFVMASDKLSEDIKSVLQILNCK